MTDVEIKNIEEMTNKLVEYIWAVDDCDEEIEFDMLSVAAKFVITSFVEKGELTCQVTGAQIIARCGTLANLCMNGGIE